MENNGMSNPAMDVVKVVFGGFILLILAIIAIPFILLGLVIWGLVAIFAVA